MWFLSFLPDIVFHIILASGFAALIISWILTFIPGMKIYTIGLQIIGVILTCAGIWYEGGIAKDKEWTAKIEEAKKTIQDLENKAPIVNTKIITQYKKEIQVVKEKGDTIKEYIDKEIVKYNDICVIPKEVIKAHNLSALNQSAKGEK